MPSDLHVHTSFSDGKLTPEEIVAAAKAAGLTYLAITDHDTVDGVGHLYENGLLPEGTSEKQRDFLENLVAAGIDCSELPGCAPDYWHKLNVWLNSLLEYHQLARG